MPRHQVSTSPCFAARYVRKKVETCLARLADTPRPITPEVAGSSPVSRANYLSNFWGLRGYTFCPFLKKYQEGRLPDTFVRFLFQELGASGAGLVEASDAFHVYGL